MIDFYNLPMPSELEQGIRNRWIEIQFNHFIETVFSIKRNSIDVLDLVQVISNIAGFPPEETAQLKKITTNKMTWGVNKYNNTELIMVGNYLGVSVKDLRKITGTTQQNINKTIKKNSHRIEDFCSTAAKDYVAIMEDFLKGFKSITEAGLFYGID